MNKNKTEQMRDVINLMEGFIVEDDYECDECGSSGCDVDRCDNEDEDEYDGWGQLIVKDEDKVDDEALDIGRMLNSLDGEYNIDMFMAHCTYVPIHSWEYVSDLADPMSEWMLDHSDFLNERAMVSGWIQWIDEEMIPHYHMAGNEREDFDNSNAHSCETFEDLEAFIVEFMNKMKEHYGASVATDSEYPYFDSMLKLVRTLKKLPF